MSKIHMFEIVERNGFKVNFSDLSVEDSAYVLEYCENIQQKDPVGVYEDLVCEHRVWKLGEQHAKI